MTIFRGEMQLLRWSETSAGGATVTFQLSDVADLRGFKDLTLAKKGMAGQRIAAMMVQVEDDVEPILEAAAPVVEKQRPGMLCIMACNFASNPLFVEWINAIGQVANDECDARSFVLETCNIQSRKELDTDPAAAKLFHSQIREPFMAWRANNN